MATKKKATKSNLPPKNMTDAQAANFYDTHSVADFWEELEDAEAMSPTPALAAAIHARAAAKAAISIRLTREQIAAAKKVAATKSVGYQTQLRMWIAEGIRRESRAA